jgi:hypothetical protein
MQQLRRIDLQGEDTVDRELVHRRVAGVVRGSHAGEDDPAPRPAAGVTHGLDRVQLLVERPRGPPQGVGLAGYLGEE